MATATPDLRCSAHKAMKAYNTEPHCICVRMCELTNLTHVSLYELPLIINTPCKENVILL